MLLLRKNCLYCSLSEMISSSGASSSGVGRFSVEKISLYRIDVSWFGNCMIGRFR